MLADISKLVPPIATALIGILTFLGVNRFYIEPRMQARETRKKYATALWIAANELKVHLAGISDQIRRKDQATIDALKKIPANDFHGNAAWFTKWGYYTTITAYKIAALSGWLRIYQHDLLFSTHRRSRKFISDLYQRAEAIKRAFSRDSCLWFDYFDAIGDRLVSGTGGISRPCTFSQFCEKYTSDDEFRLFYEQVHMFIWFLADGKYLEKVHEIDRALRELMEFLESQNLLTGLELTRPRIDVAELAKQPDARSVVQV